MTDIKSYWDDRAKTAPANAKTTNDVYLRKLEVALLAAELDRLQLPAGAAVLDVGCGDGQAVVALAERFPGVQFRGIDYSPEMISAARMALSSTEPEVISEPVASRVARRCSWPIARTPRWGKTKFGCRSSAIAVSSICQAPSDGEYGALLAEDRRHQRSRRRLDLGTENSSRRSERT